MKKICFLIAVCCFVNWPTAEDSVFDEIRDALGGIVGGHAQGDSNKIDEISRKISQFDFTEESKNSLIDVVAKFAGFSRFPSEISQSITDLIKKWAKKFSDRKKILQTDQEKREYNKDVQEFRAFIQSLNEKKRNLVSIQGLPEEVKIKFAWEITEILKNQKEALTFIKTVAVKGLKKSELENVKKTTEGHLNILDGSCGPNGALTKYRNSEDGKNDADFINILLKTKKILEDWFSQDTLYKKLKEFLKTVQDIPSEQKMPPPTPPQKDRFKEDLIKLKEALSGLKNKLKNLTDKLNILKRSMVEASFVLGKFENTAKWWEGALAYPGKITSEHVDAINQKWLGLYDDMKKDLKDIKGAARDVMLAKWVSDKILKKPENCLFIKNTEKISETLLGNIQIEFQVDLTRVANKLRQLSTEPSV